MGRDREDDGGAYDEEQTRPVSHGRKGEDLVILIDEPAAEQ